MWARGQGTCIRSGGEGYRSGYSVTWIVSWMVSTCVSVYVVNGVINHDKNTGESGVFHTNFLTTYTDTHGYQKISGDSGEYGCIVYSGEQFSVS